MSEHKAAVKTVTKDHINKQKPYVKASMLRSLWRPLDNSRQSLPELTLLAKKAVITYIHTWHVRTRPATSQTQNTHMQM